MRSLLNIKWIGLLLVTGMFLTLCRAGVELGDQKRGSADASSAVISV